MPPYREYLCNYCGHQFDELNYSQDPDEYQSAECRCGSKAKLLPSVIGGYSGVALSGARKKNSAAQGSKKAFTGNKEEGQQLEFPEITRHKEENKEYE